MRALFGPDVLRSWSTSQEPSEALRHRTEVLTACGPLSGDEDTADRIKWLRAKKAAWEAYLEASFACGMFEGDRGADLRKRLIGIDDDGFRSAMAECMTCWFLAGRMRMSVNGIAEGRGRKMLDMRVVLPDCEAGVEVKAPFRERPVGTTTWFGNDADKIRQCIAAAEKQFSNNEPNILVVAPNLRTAMFADRRVLVQAVYGESVFVFDVNAKEGRLENQRIEFSPRGKFLNTKLPSGKPLKGDGFPAYRRVSAVLCIEERVRETHPFPADELVAASILDHERGEIFRMAKKKQDLHYSAANQHWMDHDVLLLHNPHAYHPVSESAWTGFPQLVLRKDRMEWTDGYNRPV